MKKFIFFILLMLSSEYSFAAKNSIDIFCKRNISYSYINGIFNKTRADAEESTKQIKDKLKFKEEVEIKTAFNKSDGVTDLAKSIFQKYEESSSFFNKLMIYSWSKFGVMKKVDNRVAIVTQLNEQSEGSDEHIVFSHSQGNMYANIACKSEDLSLKFRNIQIASPASRIECGKPTHYTTINSDEMYLLVNSAVRGTIDLSHDSPYTLLLKVMATNANSGALLGKIDPPMKYNVTQSPLTTSSLINEKGYFKIHSVDNYLKYSPALAKIKGNFEEVLKDLKVDEKILTSKNTHIDCKNIESYVGESINEQTFSVKGQRMVASIFTEYHIEKKDKEGEYEFISQFRFFYFLVCLVIIFPVLLLFLKLFPIFFKAYAEEDERIREEKRRNQKK